MWIIKKIHYICTMENIKSKFEIYINGEVFKVSSLEEAEKKWKSAMKCEAESYIIRKDYTSNGKLIETYYVG